MSHIMQSHVLADTGSILIAFFPNGLGLAQELFVIELVADRANELVANLLLQDLFVFSSIKKLFVGSDIISKIASLSDVRLCLNVEGF